MEEFEESWETVRAVVAAIHSHAPQQPCADIPRAVQLLKKMPLHSCARDRFIFLRYLTCKLNCNQNKILSCCGWCL